MERAQSGAACGEPIAFAVIPPKQQSSNVSVHQSPGGLVTAQISRPHSELQTRGSRAGPRTRISDRSSGHTHPACPGPHFENCCCSATARSLLSGHPFYQLFCHLSGLQCQLPH